MVSTVPFQMIRGVVVRQKSFKMLKGGGREYCSTEDYLKLNVEGRWVIRNQISRDGGGGGGGKKLQAHPLVILNGMAFTLDCLDKSWHGVTTFYRQLYLQY